MILRRFKQHVQAENWFAVCIDFVVVVVGIFVGLQVNEWNEFRKDRIEEHRYLERLLDDMTASIEMQQSEIDKVEIATALLEKMVIAVRDDTLNQISAENIGRTYGRFGASGRPLTRLGTINELQAAGKFQIIEDIEIRNAVSELQQSYVLTTDIMANIQNTLSLTQNDLGRFFSIGPEYDPNEAFLRGVKLDIDAIQDNTIFLARLTFHLKQNKVLLINLQRHNEATKSVEALLRAKISDTE